MHYKMTLKSKMPFDTWVEVLEFDCDPNILGNKVRMASVAYPQCDILVQDNKNYVCASVKVKPTGFRQFRRREMCLNGNERYMTIR